MASIASASATATSSTPGNGQAYRGSFAIMTSLFFLWGIMTVFNDILIPCFKAAFTSSCFQATLVQFARSGACFVGSLIYFIISITTADPIAKLGYTNGAVIGPVISAIQSASDPKAISQIALDEKPPNQATAIEAYRRLGEVAGHALGPALTLVDGMAVIGGGISGGHNLFLPTLVAELNNQDQHPNGSTLRRLASTVFNLADAAQLKKFLKGGTRAVSVPGSSRNLSCDPLQRPGVGISRLGTSEAVAIGAYAFALRKMDNEMSAVPDLLTGGTRMQLSSLHHLSYDHVGSLAEIQS